MTNKCITDVQASSSATVHAEAELVSKDADGLTLDWTLSDGTQREFPYVALKIG